MTRARVSCFPAEVEFYTYGLPDLVHALEDGFGAAGAEFLCVADRFLNADFGRVRVEVEGLPGGAESVV